MEPASVGHIQLDIGNSSKSIVLHSSSSKIDFLGFQAVFKDMESKLTTLDEESKLTTLDETGNGPDKVFEALYSLKAGDLLNLGKVELGQHFTSPPSRYSEGALIKKLGIGRPSTYAAKTKFSKHIFYV